MHPFYRELGYAEGEYPVSEEVYKSAVTLPMFPSMTEEMINYIANSAQIVLGILSRGSNVDPKTVSNEKRRMRRRGGLTGRLSGASARTSVRAAKTKKKAKKVVKRG